jgi:hypothetical protein
MAEPRVLFLISDEGYGHLVRQSAVANYLVRRGIQVTVQCRDPLAIAAETLDPRVRIVERFNLLRLAKVEDGVDLDATVSRMAGYFRDSVEWLAALRAARHFRAADCVITDMVEEAGFLSREKETIAIGHFTWHWLLAALGSARLDAIASYLADGLSGVSAFLYTPFSVMPETFPMATAIPLIARRPRPRVETRIRLGIRPETVLVAISGGGTDVWSGLLDELTLGDYQIASDRPNRTRRAVDWSGVAEFHDVIAAADLVISRGGYSTASEALAYGTRHLIITEASHPESIENGRMLQAAGRAIGMPLQTFLADPLGAADMALTARLDTSPIDCDGALVAGRYIERRLLGE